MTLVYLTYTKPKLLEEHQICKRRKKEGKKGAGQKKTEKAEKEKEKEGTIPFLNLPTFLLTDGNKERATGNMQAKHMPSGEKCVLKISKGSPATGRLITVFISASQ